MKYGKHIQLLRHSARKLIRELGVLELDKANLNRTPQHWHALIEIMNTPNITLAKLGHLLLLPPSTMSRVINNLLKEKMIMTTTGSDKREKYLSITPKGLAEIKLIDDFSHQKIIRALKFLTEEDQHDIIMGIQKYADALEKSRLLSEQIKIHTLSTSRALRKQIINMISNIQINEFSIPITDDINAGILKAEEEYYFNQSYNFWYAVDNTGNMIGSIGLKKIDDHTGELKKFFVHQNYRGKGLAKKLLATLFKAAHKHQFKYLYLGTVDILKAAHRFYEKSGFTRITENKLPANFSKCRLDTLFFKLTLKRDKP
jgi:DNA-binding MarR family transcriptional regulator/N-acetylglutamate synthase-like GNAT family acetyltransferase